MWLANPTLLLLAPLPFALLGLRHWLRRRYWGHPGGGVSSRGLRRASRWRHLPEILAVLALWMLLVAIADPRVRRTVVATASEGHAIVIVLDLSQSMQERVGDLPPGAEASDPLPDPRPTRLDVLKIAVKDFISLRRDDRIGLVVFSENAYVISPLTTDYDYLYRYVDMIDAETLMGESYTAIGEGVAAATMLLNFQDVGPGGRGIVLVFTDGASNVGREASQAVQAMHDAGYRGHLIGVDLPDEVYSLASVQRLMDSITRTGGEYFDADAGSELELAYRQVSALELGSMRVETRTEDQSVYHWAVALCLVLFGASLALRAVPSLAGVS